jgi:hypothetical protein
MPPRYRITCIRRSDRLNHDRRIRALGGVNPDGARWMISEAALIAAIEEGRWRFCVARDGADIELVVATSRYGNKYVKALDDNLHPETLLALPECR